MRFWGEKKEKRRGKGEGKGRYGKREKEGMGREKGNLRQLLYVGN